MGFLELRQGLDLLEKDGKRRRATAEGHWDRDRGAVARRVREQGGRARRLRPLTPGPGGVERQRPR